jgi:Icc-related predicted phosphoesterase
LLVVCGHVHEAAGMETLGRTTVLNTARRAKVVTLDLRNVSSTA